MGSENSLPDSKTNYKDYIWDPTTSGKNYAIAKDYSSVIQDN